MLLIFVYTDILLMVYYYVVDYIWLYIFITKSRMELRELLRLEQVSFGICCSSTPPKNFVKIYS